MSTSDAASIAPESVLSPAPPRARRFGAELFQMLELVQRRATIVSIGSTMCLWIFPAHLALGSR
jgi:hypothetical protein